MSNHSQSYLARKIWIASILIGLLSACLSQTPPNTPATIPSSTATIADTKTPTITITPSPAILELQVVQRRINSFDCDKKGMVNNVTVEVMAEGGTLPYLYAIDGATSPSTNKQISGGNAQTNPTPAKKIKNATAVASVPPPATISPSLPGQFLVNLGPGTETITVQSADGQSVTLEVSIPSHCADLNMTQTALPFIPVGTIALTGSPTATPTLNLPRRPVCNDGLDNDGDGYVDLFDPNCKSKGDQSEAH